MQLEDLLEKPNSALTDEELQFKISEIRKLKMAPMPKSNSSTPKTRTPKSNEDKRLGDLIKKMTPEQLKELKEKLKNG